jgi:hypothetical protein
LTGRLLSFMGPNLLGDGGQELLYVDVEAGLHGLEPPQDVDEVSGRRLGVLDGVD